MTIRKFIFFLFLVCGIFAQTNFAQLGTPPQPKWLGKRAADPANCSVTTPTWYWNTGSSIFKYCSALDTFSPMSGSVPSIGGTVTGATQHLIPFFGASGVFAQSSNFTYTTATNQLKLISQDGGSAPLRININPAQNIKPVQIFNSAGSTEFFYLTQFGGIYSRGGLTVATTTGQLLMETYNADNSTRFFAVNPTDVPLIAKLAASQSGDSFQIQPNGSTTPIFKVNSAGAVTGTGFTVSTETGAFKGYGNVNVGNVNPFTGFVVIGQNDYGLILHGGTNLLPISMKVADVENARVDANATAGNTRFMIYDVDNATLERVSVGAADSCGTGFKCLKIAN